MRVNQKIRVEKHNNLSVIVRDETGFANPYNTLGYRDDLSEVEAYIFIVEDLVRREEYKFIKDNTEPIQYSVEVELSPGDKFKDSLYNVQMYTKFPIKLEGNGFEGLDFISNVAGASTLHNNYSAIIVGEDVYKIVSVERDTVFLDRVLKTDVKEFNLGFYAEKEVVIYTDVEDSIIKTTERLSDCCDEELINKLASVHLYLKGIKEATKRGSYTTAEKLLKYAVSISKQLKNCTGC